MKLREGFKECLENFKLLIDHSVEGKKNADLFIDQAFSGYADCAETLFYNGGFFNVSFHFDFQEWDQGVLNLRRAKYIDKDCAEWEHDFYKNIKIDLWDFQDSVSAIKEICRILEEEIEKIEE